jgi:soluble lytic murein transglycosylase
MELADFRLKLFSLPSLKVRSSCFLTVFAFLLVSHGAHAVSQLVTLKSDELLPSVRWMYGEGSRPTGNGVVALLTAVKDAQLKHDFDICLTRVRALRTKARSLQPWFSTVEIDCASKLSPSSAHAEELVRSLSIVEKNPAWLLAGPHVQTLRAIVIKGYMVLLAQDLKSNRARAWHVVEQLQEFAPVMDEASRATLWRSAGELSFMQQKLEAAREFFRRSLIEVDSAELRTRIQALNVALKSNPTSAPAGNSRVVNSSLEASSEELDLVERVTGALKSGELVAAVEDAVKLIKLFPGGSRAKWASDRVLEVYFNLAEKAEKNDKEASRYLLLRAQVLRELEKVDSDRLGEWARIVYNRGQYADSLTFAKQALKNVDGSRATKLLDIGAEAAVASDQFDDALSMYRTLTEKHAGTASARIALFRSALIYFRKKNDNLAIASLERLLALPQAENLELQARYWLWRSLSRSGSEDRANLVADEIVRRFPFSYYGLRARYERSGGVLELTEANAKNTPPAIESRMWLTEAERLGWERLQLLIKSGWLEEAQAELRLLPQPQRAEDKAIRASLWAAAGNYVNSAKLAAEAWDEKSELRANPFIRAVFPKEFSIYVYNQSKERSLEAALVFGLIKQESGFNARALSTSSAMGAMQIIAPTAKEIAIDLGIKDLLIPETVFDPGRNIQMGTHYLAKMLARYQGSVPLALAAYNAGPARIDRWLKSRPTLKNLVTQRTSQPLDELWIDEIPYGETSFYVKAILRNLLIYRALDQGRVQVPEPVWANSNNN